jgi:AcrR family transcriptional regulator
MAASPPQRRSSEQVRSLIVAAAAEEFAERGYTGTTTRAVASRAGISMSVLHRQFPTKEGLFTAALVAPFLEFFDDFASAWAVRGLNPWSDRGWTQAYVAKLYEHLAAHRRTLVTLLAVTEDSDNVVLDEVRSAVEDMRGKLAAMGEEEARNRGLPPEAMRYANRMLAALVTGLVLLHPFFSEGDIEEHGRLIEAAVDLALLGMDAQLRPPNE